jgi:hypothetical protein
MIRFYSDINASANTDVTGVYNTTSYRQDPTFILSAFRIVSAKGFSISLRTLSKLNKNKPLTAKLALMFFGINALSLIRLKKKIKYYLPIIFTPPRSSQSTCLQYAVFSKANTITSQGWSL